MGSLQKQNAAALFFLITLQFLCQQAHARAYLDGQVIIQYKSAIGTRSVSNNKPSLLKLEDGETVQDAVARLSQDPNVAFVEPNYLVRGTQSPSNFAAERKNWGLDKISGPQAWNFLANTATTTALLCIIDSGVDCRHPDLKDNCADGYNAITGKAGIEAALDDNGHGTQTAGVAAASASGSGLVGVAFKAKLYSCKFMNSTGIGSTFDANKCLQWCISQGTVVSINAWGSDAPGSAQSSITLKQTLAGAKNHLFITSAGNTNSAIGPNGTAFYPAMLSLPNMIVVGATDSNDKLGTWSDGGSNYGTDYVQIGAPGVGILTDDLTTRTSDPTMWYRNVAGSSIATSFVGGAAGLILSVAPDAKVSDIKQWILDGADKIDGLSSFIAGGRRLNVYNAIMLAFGFAKPKSPSPSPSPSNPPPQFPPPSKGNAPPVPSKQTSPPPPPPSPPPPSPPAPSPNSSSSDDDSSELLDPSSPIEQTANNVRRMLRSV